MCPWKITLLMEMSTFMTPSKKQKKIDNFIILCVILYSGSIIIIYYEHQKDDSHKYKLVLVAR